MWNFCFSVLMVICAATATSNGWPTAWVGTMPCPFNFVVFLERECQDTPWLLSILHHNQFTLTIPWPALEQNHKTYILTAVVMVTLYFLTDCSRGFGLLLELSWVFSTLPCFPKAFLVPGIHSFNAPIFHNWNICPWSYKQSKGPSNSFNFPLKLFAMFHHGLYLFISLAQHIICRCIIVHLLELWSPWGALGFGAFSIA